MYHDSLNLRRKSHEGSEEKTEKLQLTFTCSGHQHCGIVSASIPHLFMHYVAHRSQKFGTFDCRICSCSMPLYCASVGQRCFALLRMRDRSENGWASYELQEQSRYRI